MAGALVIVAVSSGRLPRRFEEGKRVGFGCLKNHLGGPQKWQGTPKLRQYTGRTAEACADASSCTRTLSSYAASETGCEFAISNSWTVQPYVYFHGMCYNKGTMADTNFS